MRKTWYNIKALAGSDSAEISIYDGIGMWGVSAQQFNSDLKGINAKQITVTINSPGGSLFDALAMYNGLRNHGAQITTKVMGIAASAASVVFMAGDKRVMPENTFLMVHNCIGPMNGNAADHREFADLLDEINQSIIYTYVARTGKSEEEVKALLDDESYLSATQAVDLKFADSIEPALKIAADFELDMLPENVQAAFRAAKDDPDPGSGGTELAPVLAEQISALAEEAGMGEFAAGWAMKFTDLSAVESAISDAREIKALCVLAKRPDSAAGYIKASKKLAEVRAELVEAMASADEKIKTDTTQLNPGTPPANAQPAAMKTADVWAARRNSIK
jgi:ATP-dependent protease ClpP protease subunit